MESTGHSACSTYRCPAEWLSTCTHLSSAGVRPMTHLRSVMCRVRRSFTMASLIAFAVIGRATGQGAKLRAPDARLREGLTAITSVRELSDGRVLITDPRERRVVLYDFKAANTTPIGRAGSGPGEYRNAAPITALAADSSIMIDGLARRWLLYFGAAVVGTVPVEASHLPRGAIIVGVDTIGSIGLTVPGESPTGSDSARVLALSRGSGTVSEIAKLAPPPVPRDPKAPRAWSAYEKAFRTRDGWTAVVRIAPYRVDWISPRLETRKGAPLAIPRVRVTSREKTEFMKLRFGESPVQKPELIPDWPSEVPPLDVAYPLVEAPNGELLVPRTRSAEHPTLRYDVVSRTGRLLRQIVLPPRTFVIASGRRSLYTVFRDEDDLEVLQRHPWP